MVFRHGDGVGKDGLNDGSVELHHHCYWQNRFPCAAARSKSLDGVMRGLMFSPYGDEGAQGTTVSTGEL